MSHVACESKLRSVKRSSIHQYQGHWVAIGHTVVYYARAAHTFSAGINCRHRNIVVIIVDYIESFFSTTIRYKTEERNINK